MKDTGMPLDEGAAFASFTAADVHFQSTALSVVAFPVKP